MALKFDRLDQILSIVVGCCSIAWGWICWSIAWIVLISFRHDVEIESWLELRVSGMVSWKERMAAMKPDSLDDGKEFDREILGKASAEM